MAENFLTYTEEDPNSRITVTSTKVTFASLTAQEDAYVYKDKGADSFSGNFVHLITVKLTAADSDGRAYVWALTNTVDDMKAIDDGGGSFLAVFLYRYEAVYYLYLASCDSGTVSTDTYTISLNTPYYLKIVRDESVGTYGTIYCYVYSDSARTTLIDTLIITLGTSKKDYRYIFGVNTRNSGISGRTISGYCENLILQDASEPTVTTGPVDEILPTTATAWGAITSLGNAAVTEHGHCWGASENPTTGDSKTTKGAGSLGFFYSLVTGLSVNTTYHIRAYATNSLGTSYGSDVTFITTSTGSPVVTTEICTSIAATTATGNGTITSIGSSEVTQHGHCWDTSLSPTTTDSESGEWGKTSNGMGFYGAFTSAITGLTEGTTYYIRAYATNTQGTSYGNNITLVAGGESSETSGVIAVVRERLHYVSASGIEYYIQGVEI